MGIQYLNKFLKDNCSRSIQTTGLSKLSGKKIAIDASIYLYKFAGEGLLLENMYLMISIFKYYQIIPIFIFDGKPPPEKREVLKQRKEEKKRAEYEYNHLQTVLQTNHIEEIEKQEINTAMNGLKKQFIYINKQQIEKVKELIVDRGVTYYDAPNEADELCGLLAVQKKVWGCLSEDMDMFAYGCPRVLRYLNLLNHSVVVYKMKTILQELNMTQIDFRQICVLSGTDYNNHNFNTANNNNHLNNHSHSIGLYDTMKLFKRFKQSRYKDFYSWLQKQKPISLNMNTLQEIYHMFDISNKCKDTIFIPNQCENIIAV